MNIYKIAFIAIVCGFMAVSCSDSDNKTSPSSHQNGGNSAGAVDSNGRAVGTNGRYGQASGVSAYDMGGRSYQPPQCGGSQYMEYKVPASPLNCQMTKVNPPVQRDYAGNIIPHNGPQVYRAGNGHQYTIEGNGSQPVYSSTTNDGHMDCRYKPVTPQPCPPPVVKDPYGRNQY